MKNFLASIMFAIVYLATALTINFLVDESSTAFVCSAIHGTLASILLWQLTKIVYILKRPAILSGSYVILLIHTWYFCISSFKYFVPASSSFFIQDPWERLLGTFFVWCVLSCCSMLLMFLYKNESNWSRYRPYNPFTSNHLFEALIIALPLYCMTAIYSLYQFLSGMEFVGVDRYTPYMTIILRNFGKLGKYGMMAVLCIFLAKIWHNGRRENIFLHSVRFCAECFSLLSGKSYIAIIAYSLIGVSISLSFIGGSRHFFVFLFLIILLSLLSLGKSNALKVQYVVLAILPLTLTFFVDDFTNMFNRRHEIFYDYSSNVFAFSYRSDLSDFAYSFVKEDDDVGSIKVLHDVGISLVPRILLPSKSQAKEYEWDSQLNNVGWPTTNDQDYPDTFFSMGAGILGKVGILVIPLTIVFLVYCCEVALYRVHSKSNLCPIGLFVFSLTFLHIESDPQYYFALVRDGIILSVVYSAIAIAASAIVNPPLSRSNADTVVPRGLGKRH